MKRSEFIKALGQGSAGLLLPMGLVQDKPIKIYDNYIKGLHHYNFKELKDSLKEGDVLQFNRDAGNAYDSFVIEVFWQDQKLGYLPAYENIVLANMLDDGGTITCFYLSAQCQGNWLQGMAIEVYAHLVLPGARLVENSLSAKRADDVVDIYRKGWE